MSEHEDSQLAWQKKVAADLHAIRVNTGFVALVMFVLALLGGIVVFR